MNKKTLKALKGSIKKWEKIVGGTGEDEGHKNCPLCKCGCCRCPVAIKTGSTDCDGTPYREWARHWNHKHGFMTQTNYVLCSTCERLAAKELWFLESLLPKVKK